MSSSSERSSASFDSDPALLALLREVAHPTPADPAIADHVRAAGPLGFTDTLLAQLGGLECGGAPGPGAVIDGRYRLLEMLGRGGMGLVYEALNLRTGKHVAIKWMHTQSALAPERLRSMARRFEREARAAAAIHHPNVVDIYDVGGPEAAPFLVMELLEGETLRAHMTRQPLSWEAACGLLLPVLQGVGAMHRAGVIHRDLKPDNIFLCRRPGNIEPLPKVLDFGVAAMRETGDDTSALTHSGMVLGTPAYMPLEQLTAKRVDARTDLFALGVLLYEMLTGQLPFGAARGAGELAVAQATTRPTAPSVYRPDLRGAREAMLLVALAREPERRFQTAESFAQALLTCAGPSRVERRRRIVMTVLLIGVLAGVYGLVREDASVMPKPHAPSSHVRQGATEGLQVPERANRGQNEQSRPADVKSEALSSEPGGRAETTSNPSSPVSGSRRVHGRSPSAPRPRDRVPTDLSFADF